MDSAAGLTSMWLASRLDLGAGWSSVVRWCRVRGWRRLSTQILATQLAVLVLSGAFAFGLSSYFIRQRLDDTFEQRALAVATSLAEVPAVRRDLLAGDPHEHLPALAQRVTRHAHVTYVVIADRQGIRYSHPDPEKIGKRVSTPFDPVLHGHDWVGVQTGTLGRSARGKAPIFGPDGRVIGEVSVGILESQVSQELIRLLPTLAFYLGVAVLLGGAASLLLAARMKRHTFGLELNEITDLLQEREAMLHAVREGVVALAPDGRVRLVNDEARSLLGLRGDVVGQSVAALLPSGRLRDIISGNLVTREDATVVAGERVLVLNRMPVRLGDRDLGAVVTMRDRTEPEELLRQLDAAASLTATLRAQNHEFTNRLHTLLGLLELEQYDDATEFLVTLSGEHGGVIEQVTDRIRDPVLAALLIAKVSVAAERHVSLQLAPESSVVGKVAEPVDAVTVVGNLIDNAVDAAAGAPPPEPSPGAPSVSEPLVVVDLRQRGSTLAVTVTDSGPGVAPDLRDAIFTDGFSTKTSASGARRGTGLALVQQAISRRRGTLQVGSGPGGRFHASLPGALTEAELVAVTRTT